VCVCCVCVQAYLYVVLLKSDQHIYAKVGLQKKPELLVTHTHTHTHVFCFFVEPVKELQHLFVYLSW